MTRTQLVAALSAAARRAPERFGVPFRLAIVNDTVDIQPPPISHEAPAAFCVGQIVDGKEGAALSFSGARLTAGARTAVVAFATVSLALTIVIVATLMRSRPLTGVVVAMGVLSTILLVLYAVASSATGAAEAEARLFVRRALLDSAAEK